MILVKYNITDILNCNDKEEETVSIPIIRLIIKWWKSELKTFFVKLLVLH